MKIEEYWSAVVRQDPSGIRVFFQPEATVRWHCSDESFTVEEFIRANCEYPGRWECQITRQEAGEERALTVARVFSPGSGLSFHVVSFFELQGGKIAALDEYWGTDEPAPDWRRALMLGRPIGRKDK